MNNTELKTAVRQHKKYQEVLDFYNGNEMVTDIWCSKYGYINDQIMVTPKEAWMIIAQELETCYLSYDELYSALKGFKFCPGGRILHGILRLYFARKQKEKLNLTLSNCLYIGGPDDSMESINEYLGIHMNVMKHGFGNGLHLNKLRPNGSRVNNAARTSTGVVPFANLFSEATNTVGQGGRRGATIILLDVSHPDVKQFITAKQDNMNYIKYANISVVVNDHFMQAVESDGPWTLKFHNNKCDYEEEVKARDIFDLICKSAWKSAEPGLIFKDRMVNYNPGIFHEDTTPEGVNPCGEITMAPYEQCVLGTVFLDKFLERKGNTFIFNYREFSEAVHVGVLALNAVIDYELKYDLFCLDQTKEVTKNYRRIGLGVSALADTLGLLGHGYQGDGFTCSHIQDIFQTLMEQSYTTSMELATNYTEKTIKDFNRTYWHNDFFNLHYMNHFDNPVANISINTMAPTGTLSIIAGGLYDNDNNKMIYSNSSSGIEPVFMRSYQRKVDMAGDVHVYDIYHGAYQYAKEQLKMNDEELRKNFPTIEEVKWEDRVIIQGLIQNFIDNSISSTINLPNVTTLEEVKDLYMMAWKCGCKGMTIYRVGCEREGILIEKKDDKTEKQDETVTIKIEKRDVNKPRPARLFGFTEKIKFPNENALITINHDPDTKEPIEVLLNVGKSGSMIGSFCEAIGRLVSGWLYRGMDRDFLIDQLNEIAGEDIVRHKIVGERSTVISSIPDVLAKLLNKHNKILNEYGWYLSIEDDSEEEWNGEKCPQCKKNALIKSEGCNKCLNCGYSKCT